MAQDDPYASIAKPVNDPYSSLAGGEPAITPQQSQSLHNLGQLGAGAAKGLLHTVTALPAMAGEKINSLLGNKQPESVTGREQQYSPSNTAQSIGHGLEQAGEFLIPGMGEEAATGRIAEGLRPLARIGYNAATTGALNKAQGGSATTGALMGAGGGGISEGLRALAPKTAELAIGITKRDRGFGKSPGEAIINDTKGIRPETVADSAQQKIGELNPQLESKAAQSHNFVSLKPARDVVEEAQNKAISRNAAGTHAQIQPMASHLSKQFNTGASIPPVVSAPEFLNMRRGFNDEFGQWNPETLPGVAGTSRQAYHALTNEFHQAVPDSKELDQRISNLIPVVKRAESTSRNAPLIQRGLGRFAAHTGALTSAALGATEGKREGGLPGMVVGGTAGLLAPELIATPEGRMIAARVMASPNARALLGAPVKGAMLQLDRRGNQ